MKLVIVGYGRMGQAIEAIARERGHELVMIIDKDNPEALSDSQLQQADVAIEFTEPTVATANYKKLMQKGLAVVSGTTGWLAEWDTFTQWVQEQDYGFFYASNFSLGVNIYFEVVEHLARLIHPHDYQAAVKEIHHIHKKDAPSGTAISIAERIVKAMPQYNTWAMDIPKPHALPIVAERQGEVPGTHRVTMDSPVDTLTVTHEAKSRKGFALGAVLAAEFMQEKTGVFSMKDLLQLDFK